VTRVPGRIDLGKFRVIYEQEREHTAGGKNGYLLQQRAIIRVNDLATELAAGPMTVFCDDAAFVKQAGKRPSPLQYFIASIGVCMFSQFARFASRLRVHFEDAEMDLRLTYAFSGKPGPAGLSRMAQRTAYIFRISSLAPVEQMIRVVPNWPTKGVTRSIRCASACQFSGNLY